MEGGALVSLKKTPEVIQTLPSPYSNLLLKITGLEKVSQLLSPKPARYNIQHLLKRIKKKKAIEQEEAKRSYQE